MVDVLPQDIIRRANQDAASVRSTDRTTSSPDGRLIANIIELSELVQAHSIFAGAIEALASEGWISWRTPGNLESQPHPELVRRQGMLRKALQDIERLSLDELVRESSTLKAIVESEAAHFAETGGRAAEKAFRSYYSLSRLKRLAPLERHKAIEELRAYK